MVADSVSVGQQRRLTNQEAVERRRACRRLRQEEKQQRYIRRHRRETQEKAIAERMVARFYHHTLVYEICLTYRYWQARKCGWDACKIELRRRLDNSIAEPSESAFWLWWATDLHPEQRARLVDLSGLRLIAN